MMWVQAGVGEVTHPNSHQAVALGGLNQGESLLAKQEIVAVRSRGYCLNRRCSLDFILIGFFWQLRSKVAIRCQLKGVQQWTLSRCRFRACEPL